jgi:hypothetical protein
MKCSWFECKEPKCPESGLCEKHGKMIQGCTMTCEITGCKEPNCHHSHYCSRHSVEYYDKNLADWEAGKIPKDVWEKFGGKYPPITEY